MRDDNIVKELNYLDLSYVLSLQKEKKKERKQVK